MASIDTIGGRFDAALLDLQWTRVLDILTRAQSDASQQITTTPTEFNYRFADVFGNFFVVGGKGAGFTYDAQKQVLTGTLSDLVFTQISPTDPANNYSTDLNNISVSVADFRAGTWGDAAIAGADTAPIQYGIPTFFQAASDVDTGAGNDTVSFINLNPLSLPFQPAVVDTGAGADTVTLPSQGVAINLTLGAGADVVNLQGVAIGPTADPTHTIADFSSEDTINLEPFPVLNGVPTRIWGLAATSNDRVFITSSEPDGSNGRTHAILEGVNPGSVNLTNNTLTLTPPTPTAPVFGTEGADVLVGDANPNTLIGLGGNDVIVGRAANDILIGGNDDDSIDGEAGDDQIFGEAGNDTLFGNVGNDALFGGAGNDVVFGNEGNDGIFAGAGSDIVDGGAGNDYIEGTSGFNELTGGVGNDQILGGIDVDVVNAGDGNDIVSGGAGNDVLRGDAGDDTVNGDAGNDSIDGALGNDRLFGDAGDDTLFGGAGADIVEGGAGNDTLFGGDGSDFLRAGAGTDIISGEAGGDAASFGTNDGFNFWTDFEDGVDTLIFNGDETTSTPLIFATLDGTGTWIGFGQTQIILEGVNSTLIDTNDFVVSLPSVTNQPAAVLALADEVDAA